MPDVSSRAGLQYEPVCVEVEGVGLRLACLIRPGSWPPVLFLHGFGSTKEDYADFALHRQSRGRMIVAFDAPGFGDSECSDPSVLSIPFLAKAAERVTGHFRFNRFHLVGHSMGGLTALFLARRCPEAVLSFTNIEGNLAPEDCFISRQIIDGPPDGPNAFMDILIERMQRLPCRSAALYASGLRNKVCAQAATPVLCSLVELSDGGSLLDQFIQLPCARMFVYGSDNRSLSYLPALRAQGVRLLEIPQSGHFPMYANPPALWAGIADFMDRTETNRRGE